LPATCHRARTTSWAPWSDWGTVQPTRRFRSSLTGARKRGAAGGSHSRFQRSSVTPSIRGAPESPPRKLPTLRDVARSTTPPARDGGPPPAKNPPSPVRVSRGGNKHIAIRGSHRASQSAPLGGFGAVVTMRVAVALDRHQITIWSRGEWIPGWGPRATKAERSDLCDIARVQRFRFHGDRHAEARGPTGYTRRACNGVRRCYRRCKRVRTGAGGHWCQYSAWSPCTGHHGESRTAIQSVFSLTGA
jgi:hypothetical protein